MTISNEEKLSGQTEKRVQLLETFLTLIKLLCAYRYISSRVVDQQEKYKHTLWEAAHLFSTFRQSS